MVNHHLVVGAELNVQLDGVDGVPQGACKGRAGVLGRLFARLARMGVAAREDSETRFGRERVARAWASVYCSS